MRAYDGLGRRINKSVRLDSTASAAYGNLDATSQRGFAATLVFWLGPVAGTRSSNLTFRIMLGMVGSRNAGNHQSMKTGNRSSPALGPIPLALIPRPGLPRRSRRRSRVGSDVLLFRFLVFLLSGHECGQGGSQTWPGGHKLATG